MPQPTPYTPSFSFTDFQAASPATPLPGYRVDAEFANVGQTLDGVLANLAILQRDDGALHNEIVTIDSLSPEVLALITGGSVTINVSMENIVGLQDALDAKPDTSDMTAAIAAAIAALIGTAPGVLDTLGEISDAINDDANLYTTLVAALAGKQPLDSDLTAIATLTTTSYGRALLALADQAALLALLPTATAANIQAGTADKLATAAAIIGAAAPQTLSAGATISWNTASGFNAKCVLGSAVNAFQTPTNPVEGLTYRLELVQDGTGTRTATFSAAFDFGAAGTPVLSTGANKHDFIYLDCYDASTPKFRASFNKAA